MTAPSGIRRFFTDIGDAEHPTSRLSLSGLSQSAQTRVLGFTARDRYRASKWHPHRERHRERLTTSPTTGFSASGSFSTAIKPSKPLGCRE